MMVDTNVFIHVEKAGNAAALSPWEPSERVYIDALIAFSRVRYEFTA
jgi:hypothetical protein